MKSTLFKLLADSIELICDNTTSLGESTQPGVSIVNPSGVSSYTDRASKMSNDPSNASTRVVGSADVNPNMYTSSLVEKDVVPLHNIDDVANLFGVPLQSLSDIDEFVKDLYLGKHESWFLMTKEKIQEITDIVCNRYRFLESMLVSLVEYGVMCDGSSKVSNSSPLVSPSTTVNVPQELDSIDVAVTFRVPLIIVGELQKLINDIEAGKHDELLSEMTNDDRMKTMDVLGTICNLIKADDNNVDVIPRKVSYVDDSINLNDDESTIPSDLIVQSVDINTKSKSYARAADASAKDQPKVNSNFHTLVTDPVFDGVNISIPRKVVKKVSTRFEHTLYGSFIGMIMAFLVVEYYARNNWAKSGLERIMMNSKGLFFFKVDFRAGLEAVLKGGPWLIHKSLIIFKKWSMDIRFLKEELTHIPIWVKMHDVPIQVFEEDGMVLPNKPSVLSMNGGRLDTNDGFQMVGKKKKRKGKYKFTNGGQFAGQSVKQNVRYEHKATTSAPKKGGTNVGNTSQSSSMLKTTGNSFKKDNLFMSNSFFAINDEEEDDEEDENVYDESANLNTKAGGSSSFTTAVAMSWMAFLASAALIDGMTPLESRICLVGSFLSHRHATPNTLYWCRKVICRIQLTEYAVSLFNQNGSIFIEPGIRSIRRIKEDQYGVLGFIGVGTLIILFHNIPELAMNTAYVFFLIRRIALQVFVVSCEVQVQIRRIFLMDTANIPIMRTSKYDESNASALEDLTLLARNPVKEPPSPLIFFGHLRRDSGKLRPTLHRRTSCNQHHLHHLHAINIITTLTSPPSPRLPPSAATRHHHHHHLRPTSTSPPPPHHHLIIILTSTTPPPSPQPPPTSPIIPPPSPSSPPRHHHLAAATTRPPTRVRLAFQAPRPRVRLVGLIAPRSAFGLDGPKKGVFVYGFKQPKGCLVLGLTAAKRAVWFSH
uniref:Zinc knuckle CX2CX4HX4C n=1 Tax=Tanacetum cinerariifolium TaxID=118510 RepID=A0A6L2K7T0_TANCI|nr:zinc knuckle CX2CX4HX4C [Tanacetum cinerariifolium]